MSQLGSPGAALSNTAMTTATMIGSAGGVDDDAGGVAWVGISGRVHDELPGGARLLVPMHIVALSCGLHTVGNLLVVDRVSGRSFSYAQLFDVVVVAKSGAS